MGGCLTIDTRELFSAKSDEYAAARPHYPRELFQYLVGLCADTHRVWDCGTGSGQATVAQALHWFDLSQFWPEVHRVLRPGGIFAAWTYTTPFLSEALDAIVAARLLSVIKNYWAPQNQIAWDAYATITFPFHELVLPKIAMQVNWNLPQFTAYLGTWSATRRCIATNGTAFFDMFIGDLQAAWGDPSMPRVVTMEFFCRVGAT